MSQIELLEFEANKNVWRQDRFGTPRGQFKPPATHLGPPPLKNQRPPFENRVSAPKMLNLQHKRPLTVKSNVIVYSLLFYTIVFSSYFLKNLHGINNHYYFY